jgi:hypothetical protein
LFGGCLMYEMKAYENRLFFLKVTGAGDVAVSAEDALIAQHASLALKRRETSSAGNKEAPVEVLERRARNRDKTSAQVSMLRSASTSLSTLTVLQGSFCRVSLHFDP